MTLKQYLRNLIYHSAGLYDKQSDRVRITIVLWYHKKPADNKSQNSNHIMLNDFIVIGVSQ